MCKLGYFKMATTCYGLTPTGIVVWPEVSYLRVVDSFPTQWTRLSTEPVCVGSRLHKPVVYTKAWWTP
jgi:hypothetical protein